MKKAKILALVLAVVMVCSLLAACKTTEYTVKYYNGTEQIGTETVKEGEFAKGIVSGYIIDGDFYTDAEMTEPNIFDIAKTAITKNVSLYGSWIKNEIAGGSGHTYSLASSVFPTNWNPHVYQTDTDNDILSYITSGFYDFDYNEKKDGYKVVPSMATGFPEDVTSEYTGESWGIAADDAAKAWKITLRNDLKWNDGTAIKAADFVVSAGLLLAPGASNYRADTLYSGDMVIYNAENYVKQGKKGYFAVSEIHGGMQAAIDAGVEIYFDLDVINATFKTWYGGTYEQVKAACLLADFDIYTGEAGNRTKTGENFFLKYVDGKISEETPRVVIQAEQLAEIIEAYSNCDEWNPDADVEVAALTSVNYTYPELTLEEVGVKALSDTELVIILARPLSGFYLHYSLTSSWLVKADVYNACITNNGGVYSNSYGTAAANTVSYGPYKLTSFQADKSYILERNDKWFGFNDDEEIYQTDKIWVRFVAEAYTRLQMFLSGQLDSYGLASDDMKDYSSSDNTYYTTGDSTFFIAMNPDLEALKKEQADAGTGKNKTILTLLDFRQAISFSLDRAAFCLATAPTNNPAFALYSGVIISDPENGTAYRTTDEAKQTMVNFWGLANDIGAGKLYPTIDDAIESITGYNLAKAKLLFNSAYDKAIENGLMTANDKIEIKIGTPNLTSGFYNNGYNFLVNNYTEAVKGTKLEGKLTFTRDGTLGNDFSSALKNNKVDMLFGVGWTGSALNPYGLIEAYTSSGYQYDPSWKTDTALLTIELEGVESGVTGKVAYTATVAAWTAALGGSPITLTKSDSKTVKAEFGTSKPYAERLPVLAALENAVLEQYDMIPIMDDSSAALKGMKVKFYTEEYIFGLGRGGVKYMTYNYNDDQWKAFVDSKNGILNYK